MANFDDLDPLGREPDVNLIMLKAGQPIPGDADLVLIPGSKSTIGDLAFAARRAGILIYMPIIGVAGIFWAYVAAIRCWGV